MSALLTPQVLSELRAGAAQCGYMPARAANQWLLDHWPGLLLCLWFAVDEPDYQGRRFIDWDLVGEALKRKGKFAKAFTGLSGGERAAIQLAASLGCGHPVDLGELWRLDSRGHQLLVAIANNRR